MKQQDLYHYDGQTSPNCLENREAKKLQHINDYH